MVKRPELMAASTQYDPTTGRYSQKEPERVMARRMTLAAIQRHWIFGSAVCVACIVCEDRIKDSYGRGDAANEPVGALLGVLGSIYGLCFAFAFQSSKQRILDLSVALTAEVSALTRLQLLSATHNRLRALKTLRLQGNLLTAEQMAEYVVPGPIT